MTDHLAAPATPVFDGHNDLLLRMWMQRDSDPVTHFLHGSLPGQMDLARLRAGGFAGGLFAVFVPPVSFVQQSQQAYLERDHDPFAITQGQIALCQQIAAQSAGRAKICHTVGDIERCLQQGVLAMVLHIEGAEALDEDFSQLDGWIDAGLRSIGPVWNLANRFGEGVTGAFPGSPDSGEGLTPTGLRLLRTLNEKRLMIDLSHMNARAFWQTANLSTAPLVATHSNVHAICPQPRNLTRDQLTAIAESDGFVGVNFGNAFLRPDGKRDSDTPLDQILRHLEGLMAILGEDRVGFGSDFDGISVPEALGDAAGLPRLIAAMQAAGYSPALIEKISFRNWLAVLKKTWGE